MRASNRSVYNQLETSLSNGQLYDQLISAHNMIDCELFFILYCTEPSITVQLDDLGQLFLLNVHFRVAVYIDHTQSVLSIDRNPEITDGHVSTFFPTTSRILNDLLSLYVALVF
jgi:hypothetical protein